MNLRKDWWKPLVASFALQLVALFALFDWYVANQPFFISYWIVRIAFFPGDLLVGPHTDSEPDTWMLFLLVNLLSWFVAGLLSLFAVRFAKDEFRRQFR